MLLSVSGFEKKSFPETGAKISTFLILRKYTDVILDLMPLDLMPHKPFIPEFCVK